MTTSNDTPIFTEEQARYLKEALLLELQSEQIVKRYDENPTQGNLEAATTILSKMGVYVPYLTGIIAALRADADAANARAAAAERALKGLLDRYTTLINSGDCGNWNVEEEDEVIAARAVLPVTVVHKTHDVSVDGHWFPLTPTDSDVITVTTVTDGSAEE